MCDSAATPAPDNDPVVNLERALRRLGQDANLLKELATLYLEDVPLLLVELERGLDAADAELVTRSAHSIKGLSSNFDALGAVAAARAVETSGRQSDLAQAHAAFPRLKSELDAVIRELESQLLAE